MEDQRCAGSCRNSCAAPRSHRALYFSILLWKLTTVASHRALYFCAFWSLLWRILGTFRSHRTMWFQHFVAKKTLFCDLLKTNKYIEFRIRGAVTSRFLRSAFLVVPRINLYFARACWAHELPPIRVTRILDFDPTPLPWRIFRESTPTSLESWLLSRIFWIFSLI